MKAVGFDFHHGRLDISHHPFCGGVPSDVRMTTRYRTDEFLSSLMGILHETGHGLYEQNLPHDLVALAQRRRRAAWRRMRARACSRKCSCRGGPSSGNSPCRKARDILGPRGRRGRGHAGPCAPRGARLHPRRCRRGDLSAACDPALRDRAGADRRASSRRRTCPKSGMPRCRSISASRPAGNSKDGPMQDVHWPSGAFGYFPSYTLGAMMAAQQWAAVERAVPDASAPDRARRLLRHQRLAEGEHLVEGLDALHARDHAAGDGRTAQRQVFRGASEGSAISPDPHHRPPDADQAERALCPRCRISCARISSTKDVSSTTEPTALISGVMPRRMEEKM